MINFCYFFFSPEHQPQLARNLKSTSFKQAVDLLVMKVKVKLSVKMHVHRWSTSWLIWSRRRILEDFSAVMHDADLDACELWDLLADKPCKNKGKGRAQEPDRLGAEETINEEYSDEDGFNYTRRGGFFSLRRGSLINMSCGRL